MLELFILKTDVAVAKAPAATMTRRMLLKHGAVAGVTAAFGPRFIKDARSSSGELRLMNWSDELPAPVIQNFASKTGIKVATTPLSRVDEVLNKLQATEGEGFDVLLGALPRAPQFKEVGLIVPWKTTEFALDDLVPSLSRTTEERWSWEGGLYYISHMCGAARAWHGSPVPTVT